MEAALLPALLGWGRAAELVLTGDIFEARDMYQFGFVQKLVPASELDAAVDKWIQSILVSGPHAVRLQKSLMRDWERMSLTDSIRRGIEMCVEARRTDEPAKLMAAFLARKKK
jgi:enoyl-CoA hydratase/carnithine racemase